MAEQPVTHFLCMSCDAFFPRHHALTGTGKTDEPTVAWDKSQRTVIVIMCPKCGGTELEEHEACMRCFEAPPKEGYDECAECLKVIE